MNGIHAAEGTIKIIGISFITLSRKGCFIITEQYRGSFHRTCGKLLTKRSWRYRLLQLLHLVYAATKDVKLMAEIANISGGLVCEEVGTAAINKQRLIEECKLLLS